MKKRKVAKKKASTRKATKKKTQKKKTSKQKSTAKAAKKVSETMKEVRSRLKTQTKKKEERIKTGITNLDSCIQGGLKKRSITIASGNAGAGKTIFSIQFIIEGLKRGEKCLYISFEEKKKKLYDDIAEFDWDLEAYEKKGLFFYLEYSPEQVKSLIEEGGGTVDHMISKHKISRLVIDSVTSFALLYQDELSRKEAGLALFGLINKWGCTAVLTSQKTESSTHAEISTSLEFEADAIISIYNLKHRGKRIRALEIVKMRGTDHANTIMKMDISRKGMTVHPKQMVTYSIPLDLRNAD